LLYVGGGHISSSAVGTIVVDGGHSHQWDCSHLLQVAGRWFWQPIEVRVKSSLDPPETPKGTMYEHDDDIGCPLVDLRRDTL
jgi:hypothetical protein